MNRTYNQAIHRLTGKRDAIRVPETVAKATSKTRGEAAEKILHAAEELFATHGFAAVSVRDIAERAGVNKALVFYYYENKAALLDRVLEQYYEAHMAALVAPSGENVPVREGLRALLNSYLDFIEVNYRYLQIVQHELASNADNLPMIRAGIRMLYDRVDELLGDLTSEGHLHSRQFYVSFSGIVVSYFNFAPVLDVIWEGDPLSEENRRERRAHLLWMVDRILDGLGVD